MIKIISFDIDKTLITGEFDDKVWNEDLPLFYSKKNNISFEEAKNFVFEKYKEYKGINEWTSIPFWFNKFGLDNWEKLLMDNLHHIKLNEGVLEILEKLHKKYKLIIVTQNPKEFFEKKLINIEHYFDEIYSSTYHYNQLNKDKKVYLDILKKLNVKANEIIHIGDDLEFDYNAPKSVGIKAILLDPLDEHKIKDSARNMDEVYEIIEGLSKN
jgi:HAD superfamily hydrolase (TIGR01549 family)